MPSKWALDQQRKLEEIGKEIGMDIKVSHLKETLYLPMIDKKEQIITYPDGLMISEDRIIGVVEIEGVIGPKKLAGDIFATDAAMGKEKQKHERPFLVIAVKKLEKGQKKKLDCIVRYAKKRCKYLADVQLCSIGKLKDKIKELTTRS